MFIVFNKQKIYSYIIALSTIVILFCGATVITKEEQERTIQTSAKENKELPIYSVETQENKIALTMNCAWSQFQMG